jgi:hypothetical protein
VRLTEREGVQVTGVWLLLATLRMLAALPITQPRIFRDELLHWQLARSLATGTRLLAFGQPVDYPAMLYPSLLGPAFLARDPHVAFHVAQSLNALMVSAVVLSTYALARELAPHRKALAAAALAGLAPGGVYSALIMEESLYYPLFVLSCWLCLRVLLRGDVRDAAACTVALALTYFTKPLAVPLVAAYAGVVVLWALAERWRATREGSLGAATAIRLAPVAAFGLVLVLRYLITARTPAEAVSAVVLGRFYTQELGGPIVPPVVPLLKVMLALAVALTMAMGIAPAMAMLGGWRERIADRPRLWLTVLALAAALVYAFAAARHTMIVNDEPKIHERYVFAVAPLFLVLFITTEAVSLAAATIVAGCVALAALVATLDTFALRDNAWITAPSLTVPWLLRGKLGSGVAIGALLGAAAAVVCWGATRAKGAFARAPRWSWVAAPLVVLNLGWYAFVYRIQGMLDPIVQTVSALETRTPSGSRVTAVLREKAPPMQTLVWYVKFWLDDRATIYWAGEGRPPTSASVMGAATDAVRATSASYLLGTPDIRALCPSAVPVPALTPDSTLGVVVIAVPESGCTPAR